MVIFCLPVRLRRGPALGMGLLPTSGAIGPDAARHPVRPAGGQFHRSQEGSVHGPGERGVVGRPLRLGHIHLHTRRSAAVLRAQ